MNNPAKMPDDEVDLTGSDGSSKGEGPDTAVMHVSPLEQFQQAMRSTLRSAAEALQGRKYVNAADQFSEAAALQRAAAERLQDDDLGQLPSATALATLQSLCALLAQSVAICAAPITDLTDGWSTERRLFDLVMPTERACAELEIEMAVGAVPLRLLHLLRGDLRAALVTPTKDATWGHPLLDAYRRR